MSPLYLRALSARTLLRKPVQSTIPCLTIRHTSSTTSPPPDLQTRLQEELLSRPPQIIHDYLTPTPSHLLNLSLSSFLPASCAPPAFTPSSLPGRHDENPLPQGHHLLYFPAQVPSSELLPDGTDVLQSPGPPFTRRMWAGGSLLFNQERKYALDLDATRAVCIESVTDVRVRGREGEEKVFVGIERRVGYAGRALRDGLHDAYDEEWRVRLEERVEELKSVSAGEEVGGLDGLGLVERRVLVFLRERKGDVGGEVGKLLKPVHEPDFSVKMTPTQQLLFRFSALSFNAHGIHLDPQYCREVEGYRNLLVHGPLSLILMLSVLRSQLQPGEMILKFDYRNLAPLFAEEEMKICVRRDKERDTRWDVWVEGAEGGYAVKGTAVVGVIDAPRNEEV